MPRLSDVGFDDHKSIREACKQCWKNLNHLSGYIDAYGAELNDDLILLQLVDAKYSFELEGEMIALGRLFEAYSSENILDDRVSQMIIAFSRQYVSAGPALSTVKPGYIQSRKTQDLLREKGHYALKSYYTNLTLYTAPSTSTVIRKLRDELEDLLQSPPVIDELHFASLVHLQLRALSPFTVLNHHSARMLTELYIRSLDRFIYFLPLASVIYVDKEKYQVMVREVMNSGRYQDWVLYFLELISNSAVLLMQKLGEIQIYKSKVYDMLSKYTAYNLPANGLMKVLFSRPYIKAGYLITGLSCHRQTAYTYLEHLVRMGLLVEKKSGREKLYLHKELLDVITE